METPEYFEALKGSRKRLLAGDVFAVKPKGHDYLFGRVIRTDARVVSFTNCFLVYLYNVSAKNLNQLHLSDLTPKRLLLPPLIINRLPWSRGIFMTVGNFPIDRSDLLERHCFKTYEGRFFDEVSNQLSQPYEPVGIFGLWSYAALGEALSKILPKAALE
ncbi:MAG TPA: Imm26 family immunity protein [Azonexus sp.]|nr:Imm26 family immunity protein [Azonexus sp.]